MADWKATGLLAVCKVEFLICNAPPTELEYIRRGIFCWWSRASLERHLLGHSSTTHHSKSSLSQNEVLWHRPRFSARFLCCVCCPRPRGRSCSVTRTRRYPSNTSMYAFPQLRSSMCTHRLMIVGGGKYWQGATTCTRSQYVILNAYRGTQADR